MAGAARLGDCAAAGGSGSGGGAADGRPGNFLGAAGGGVLRPLFAGGDMQQGLCGGISETGAGEGGGEPGREDAEALALRRDILYPLVRSVVYGVSVGIGKRRKGTAMMLTADGFGDMRGMVMKLMTDGFGGTEERR